jgi:hypothetical protein
MPLIPKNPAELHNTDRKRKRFCSNHKEFSILTSQFSTKEERPCLVKRQRRSSSAVPLFLLWLFHSRSYMV